MAKITGVDAKDLVWVLY